MPSKLHSLSIILALLVGTVWVMEDIHWTLLFPLFALAVSLKELCYYLDQRNKYLLYKVDMEIQANDWRRYMLYRFL